MKFLVIMFVMLASLIHIKATTITLTNNMECVNIDMPLKPFIHENFKDQYDHDGTMTINFNITNTNFNDNSKISYGINNGDFAINFTSSGKNRNIYTIFVDQSIMQFVYEISIKKNIIDTPQNFIRFFICGEISDKPMSIEYQFTYRFRPEYEITTGFLCLMAIICSIIGFGFLKLIVASSKEIEQMRSENINKIGTHNNYNSI